MPILPGIGLSAGLQTDPCTHPLHLLPDNVISPLVHGLSVEVIQMMLSTRLPVMPVSDPLRTSTHFRPAEPIHQQPQILLTVLHQKCVCKLVG